MADIDIPSGTAKDNARAKQPVVAYACLYQRLALVAREHGYALAMHGSLAADLDLVAVPWTHEAVSGEALAEALATAIPGHLHLDTYARPRPGGVRKHVIHLGGGPYLDLAVTPLAALSPPPPAAPAEMPVAYDELRTLFDALTKEEKPWFWYVSIETHRLLDEIYRLLNPDAPKTHHR